MQGYPVVVTAPTLDLISLAELKVYLRVDHTDEDLVLAGLLRAERSDLELTANRTLLTTTYDWTLDAWPSGDSVELPRPPLQSVTSITYIDYAGVTNTFASANYIVDTAGGRVALAYNCSWPSTTLRPAAAIKIRYVAGWTTRAAVPPIYYQALLLGCQAAYERDGLTPPQLDRLTRAKQILLDKDRVWQA